MSLQIDLDHLTSDFDSAVHLSDITTLSIERAKSEHKTGGRRQMDIEEVEDESWEELRARSKSDRHLLIHEDEVCKEERPPATKHPLQFLHRKSPIYMKEVEDEYWTEYCTKPKLIDHVFDVLEDACISKETTQSERIIYTSESFHEMPTNRKSEYHGTSIPPPLKESKPIRMNKK